jgi:hypothetical protein
MTTRTSRVRPWSLAPVVALFALLSSCDCVPCPDGYACTLGRCQPTHATDQGTPAEDLASSSEMSLPHGDLSKPADLAPPCVMTGGSCYLHRNAVCCSKYCVYSTNKCR